MLSWSVLNADGATDSCTPSGWNDGKPLLRSEFVTTSKSLSPLNAHATYSLSCTNEAGTAEDRMTIKINAPTVTLTADTTSVEYKGNTILRWSVTDVTSCTASNGWSGDKGVSGGTYDTGALTSNHIYRLSCTGPGGTISKSVTVEARPLRVITLYFRCSVSSKGADLSSYYPFSACEWSSTGYPDWPRLSGRIAARICQHPGNPTIPTVPLMDQILARVGLTAPKMDRVERVSYANVDYCADGGQDGTQGIFKVFYP